MLICDTFFCGSYIYLMLQARQMLPLNSNWINRQSMLLNILIGGRHKPTNHNFMVLKCFRV